MSAEKKMIRMMQDKLIRGLERRMKEHINLIFFFLDIIHHMLKAYVRWDPCPHSMARPRVADGGTASRYGG
jgi:hypothetical protein